MVTVMSTSIAIMDANMYMQCDTGLHSVIGVHDSIEDVIASSSRVAAVSVPNEEKQETLASVGLRSVAMSVNIANSVQHEVSHLIKVDSSVWDLETVAEKNEAKCVEQMISNINMARSTCSHILPEQNENIILAIVLSKWDDIMGPQTLHVWLKDNSFTLETHEEGDDKHVCAHEKDVFLMKAIKYVTCHTVNFMAVNPGICAYAPVTPTFHERNTSLFVVPDLEIVVQSVTFSIRDHELSVPCSLALVVHYKHYEYFLTLRHICQLWLRRLTHQLHLVLAMSGMRPDTDVVTSAEMAHWMTEFNLMLISLNKCGLGSPRRRLPQEKYGKHVLDYPFIEQALVSHLQTRGCSVVMGTSTTSVNAMIEFLALFLAPEELFSSRLVHPAQKYSFHMGLHLQGLLLDEFGCRQLSPDELSANPYPVTAIDLTRASSACAVKQSLLMQSAGTTISTVFTTSDNRRSSKLVRGLLADLKQLPTDNWQQLIQLFMSKVKALSRTLINLAKRTGYRGEGLETKSCELQKHLALVMDFEEADFLIVQAVGDKLEPGSSANMFNSEPNYR